MTDYLANLFVTPTALRKFREVVPYDLTDEQVIEAIQVGCAGEQAVITTGTRQDGTEVTYVRVRDYVYNGRLVSFRVVIVPPGHQGDWPVVVSVLPGGKRNHPAWRREAARKRDAGMQ